MTGLRALVESDLAYTLEGDGGQPIVLIAPDGTKYATNANDPTKPLMAMVLYDQRKASITETGAEVITYEMAITVRRSSLARIPAPRENWGILVPSGPRPDAPVVLMTLGPARAAEGGRSIGFIRFYPKETEQK